jgi:hypothetical protein
MLFFRYSDHLKPVTESATFALAGYKGFADNPYPIRSVVRKYDSGNCECWESLPGWVNGIWVHTGSDMSHAPVYNENGRE